MSSLRPQERCPIHRSLTCCGRAAISERSLQFAAKYREISPGMRVYPDGHIERSPAALKRRKDALLRAKQPCRACGLEFDDYSDVELAHDQPKGMNGWKRDDSDENTFLIHSVTNRDQGSRSWEDYAKLMKGKKYPCEKRRFISL
jgi:hypothetical protein